MIINLLLLTAVLGFNAAAQTSVNFESFSTGSPHNQQGWKCSGCAPSSPGYDMQITTLNPPTAPFSFGTKSLRVSNGVGTTAFGDFLYTVSLANEAGETSAQGGGQSGGVRQNKFSAEWQFISTTPNAEQSGLSVVASPDRGDGARMSWVQTLDTPGGIQINFSDYQTGVGFVQTTIASGLSRTIPHTIRIEMDFVDGVANDVVRVYIDGVLAHAGTSWEDYFRDQETNPTRTVDSILFRTSVPVAGNLNKGFLIDNMTLNSGLAPTTVVVNSTGSTPNLTDWFFYNDENDTINQSLGSFVGGPGTPPLGVGSAQISVSGTQRRNLATYQFSGTPLANISTLRYSTYNPSAGNGGSANRSGYLHFNVDFNGSDTFQRRLVYVPSVNGTVIQNQWQEWDAINGGNALWRYSGATWAMGVGGGGEPGTTAKTWAQILSQYPGVRIRVTDSFMGIRVGEPYADGYTENIDAFKFGTTAGTKHFNFEPVAATLVVDDDGQASATDCDASDAASTTIDAAVTAAGAGDTVRVCPGTYPVSSTILLNKSNLTVVGAGLTKPVIQVANSVGNVFRALSPGVTLENLEIQKTDVAGVHNLIQVLANNFTAQNNLIYGPNPGGTWSATGHVSRAFEVTGGLTGLVIQNNTIHTLRQPAYINPNTSGVITNNNVSGTKGWVVDGAILTFTGNTWGEPQNQDCDIALLASVNSGYYTPLLALSANNDNAFICAQYTGGENGRAIAYVNSGAAPGGNGSDNTNYQTINAGVAGTLTGGTVNVAAGTYNEDVTVGKTVIVSGAGSAGTVVSGPIGGNGSTFIVTANNVEIRGFTITRAGNNPTDWNNPGLNSAGLSVQGLAITGMNIHDNRFVGNRTAIDINNSNGHTMRNNVFTDNRTGLIFRNQTDNITFVENEVTNNWTAGILFLDASGGTNSPVQTALNSNFSNNNISGNWYGGIVERQSGGSLPTPGTNLKNFSGNWFGTTTPVVTTANSAEPGYAAQIPVAYGGSATNPGGAPDIAGPASANFDYSPYLNSGSDTNVQTTPGRGTFGFQGSFANLTVTAASPQANGALGNIQEGINLTTAGGTLNVLNGTYAGNVNINKALTLKGTPTINGTLTTSAAGATLSPGFSPGIINSGSLSLISGSLVNIEINGATPGTGHDQLNVTGTVSLGGATLNVTSGFTPLAGTNFVIVNNDGGDPVTGTFAGLAEGASFYAGAVAYTISYAGGDGNDVVLTASSLCNTVTVPNATTQTGVPVTVPVSVDDVTGKNILSFDFTLTYNPSVVASPTVNLTPMTSGRVLTVNSTTPGTLIVSVFGSMPLTGMGDLVTVTFNSVPGGIGSTSPLSFSSFRFNEGTTCLTVNNGSVTIISGTLSGTITYAHPSPVKPVPNTTLSGVGSVNVSTTTNLSGQYTLSGFGAGAYTVTPSKSNDVNGIDAFDSSKIAQHVVGLAVPALNAVQIQAADVSGNGEVTSFDAALIARWTVSLPNSGSTGTWRFTPVNRSYPSGIPSNVSGEDYTALLMGDVSGNWLPPTMLAELLAARSNINPETALGVSIPNMSAASNANFVIPIAVQDMTDKGIVSYQFDLIYDASVIQPLENPCVVAETLSSTLLATCNGETPGLLKVAVYGAIPTSNSGTLLNLKFNAIGAAGTSSPLTLQEFKFNDGNPQSLTTNGRVQVNEVTAETGSIAGRLTTSTGDGVANAKVLLMSNSGERRLARSSSLGYYRFDNIRLGETYVVHVNAKRYTFAPQNVNPNSALTELNLIAEQ